MRRIQSGDKAIGQRIVTVSDMDLTSKQAMKDTTLNIYHGLESSLISAAKVVDVANVINYGWHRRLGDTMEVQTKEGLATTYYRDSNKTAKCSHGAGGVRNVARFFGAAEKNITKDSVKLNSLVTKRVGKGTKGSTHGLRKQGINCLEKYGKGTLSRTVLDTNPHMVDMQLTYDGTEEGPRTRIPEASQKKNHQAKRE